jgi:hypothetical protein
LELPGFIALWSALWLSGKYGVNWLVEPIKRIAKMKNAGSSVLSALIFNSAIVERQ